MKEEEKIPNQMSCLDDCKREINFYESDLNKYVTALAFLDLTQKICYFFFKFSLIRIEL